VTLWYLRSCAFVRIYKNMEDKQKNYKLFIETVKKERNNVLNILSNLYENTNYDFRLYRETTMYRRICRRFFFSRTNSFEEYYKYIDGNPTEYENLINTLTINVTEFFRDEKFWNLFENECINILFDNLIKKNKKVLNVWSAGCSSGQETYSLAITLHEYIRKNNLDIHVNIIGTDIDADNLNIATLGHYDKDLIMSSPASKYINKYFYEKNRDEFSVSLKLKNSVNYINHSLVNDKFFSDIDLIVCRNVFIYFLKPLQEKIIKNFDKSLNPGGLIWFGKAESLDLNIYQNYQNLNTNAKIFLKKI
jgi:chemotaxis methyl-accepting protein methylase